MRFATYNTELSRKGPGLLLRDILLADDPQIFAVADEIVRSQADVIALQGFDYDLENRALQAFADLLEIKGARFDHIYTAPPNAGLATEIDLDGDGRLGVPGDAQGFGRFFGQGSMAILSRFPIDVESVQDFSSLLWRALPDALLPTLDGQPFPSAEARGVQRLSSHGHWVVPILHPDLGHIDILTYHATPPVFDGPEDRNGKRNHDETMFWLNYLGGVFGPVTTDRFVILADANLDPNNGDGRGQAMRRLLAHPSVQDPLAGRATVNWAQTGPLRVDYALPSSDWTVLDAQVQQINPQASRHALVWVEVTR